jgi:hypothetical protein
MHPAPSAKPASDDDGVRDVVTQGDEYLRPRQEQAKDQALDPTQTTGGAPAPGEADLPALTPTSTEAGFARSSTAAASAASTSRASTSAAPTASTSRATTSTPDTPTSHPSKETP